MDSEKNMQLEELKSELLKQENYKTYLNSMIDEKIKKLENDLKDIIELLKKVNKSGDSACIELEQYDTRTSDYVKKQKNQLVNAIDDTKKLENKIELVLKEAEQQKAQFKSTRIKTNDKILELETKIKELKN